MPVNCDVAKRGLQVPDDWWLEQRTQEKAEEAIQGLQAHATVPGCQNHWWLIGWLISSAFHFVTWKKKTWKSPNSENYLSCQVNLVLLSQNRAKESRFLSSPGAAVPGLLYNQGWELCPPNELQPILHLLQNFFILFFLVVLGLN
jgi:hypothetical protein